MRISDWSSVVFSSDLHPRLARLPGGAAEAVELDPFALRAEARQHLDVLHRHVELVAALVDHLEEIVRRTGGVQGLQPLVAADAVVDVDHQVLLLQGGDPGEDVLGTAPGLRRSRYALAADVLPVADDMKRD